MEKQLDNVGKEAINDLNDIFDQVVVNKILSKSEQNQKKLITGISEIRKDLEFQDDLQKDVKVIHGKIGIFNKDYYDEDENKDYYDDRNEVNMSSVLKGLAKKSRGIESKLHHMKNMIGEPLAGSKEENKNSLFTLIQRNSDLNIDEVQKAKKALQEQTMDKLELENKLNKIENNQMEIKRQIADLLECIEINDNNTEKRYTILKDTYQTTVEELNMRLDHELNQRSEETKLILEELRQTNQEANEKSLIINKYLKYALALGAISVTVLITLLILALL